MRKPWHQLSKEEYDFVQPGKRYALTEMQAVAVGLLDESKAVEATHYQLCNKEPTKLDGYTHKNTSLSLFSHTESQRQSALLASATDLADDQHSIQTMLEKFKRMNFKVNRLLIPVYEQSTYSIINKQRKHWTLLCIDFNEDANPVVTFYDPKPYVGYNISSIETQVLNVYPEAQFETEYVGKQGYFNDTEFGLHVAQFCKSLAAGRELNTHYKIGSDLQHQHWNAYTSVAEPGLAAVAQGWSFIGFWRHYQNTILTAAAIAGLILATVAVTALTLGIGGAVIASIAAALTLGAHGTGGVVLAGAIAFAAVPAPVVTATYARARFYPKSEDNKVDTSCCDDPSDFEFQLNVT